MDSITKETEGFFKKILTGDSIGSAEILMMYTSYCYAMRQALGLAVQMLYEAIIGLEMPVMNNDNIINLVKHSSDIVYEKYVILIQGGMHDFVGSMSLLVCDPNDEHHIKEFGEIIAMTVNYNREFGSTSRVTMVTVNEELNPIHRFTDTILQTPFGRSPVVVRRPGK